MAELNFEQIKEEIKRGKEKFNEILKEFEEEEKLKKVQEILKNRPAISISNINDVFSYIPNSATLKNVKLLYVDLEKDYDPIFGSLIPKMKFKIFKAQLETGADPIFIIAKPGQYLTAETSVVLRPIPFDKLKEYLQNEKVQGKILKELGLKQKSKKEEIDFFEIVSKDFYFYEIIEELPIELFEEILKVPNSLKDLAGRVLKKDQVDERIYWLEMMRFLNFSTKVKPEFQRFQPHALVICNTKIGKTTLSQNLFEGCVYDAGSSARLLGFSTAEETYPSELDGRIDPIFLDDLASRRWETHIFDALPNLMENGFSKVCKGAVSINTRTLTAFTFFTNTKNLQATSKDLLEDFYLFLSKFTESPQRIGSRIGLILFGNYFTQVIGTLEFDKKAIWLWKQICKKLSEKIEWLISRKEIKAWLDSRIEYYSKKIDLLLKNILTYEEKEQFVVSFWLGQKEAYRHINGGAFLLAFLNYALDHQEDILNDAIDLKTLQEYFEEWQQRICEWNLKSLESMISQFANKDELLMLQYETISIGYQKLLLNLLMQFAKDNRERIQFGLLYPFDVLKETFEKLPKSLKTGRYTYFSRLKEKIPSNIDLLNQVFSVFGVKFFYTIIGDVRDLFVSFLNGNLFELMRRIEEDINKTPLGEGEVGEVKKTAETTSFSPENKGNNTDFPGVNAQNTGKVINIEDKTSPAFSKKTSETTSTFENVISSSNIEEKREINSIIFEKVINIEDKIREKPSEQGKLMSNIEEKRENNGVSETTSPTSPSPTGFMKLSNSHENPNIESKKIWLITEDGKKLLLSSIYSLENGICNNCRRWTTIYSSHYGLLCYDCLKQMGKIIEDG